MPPQLAAAFKKISTTVAGFSFAQKTVSILAILVLALGITGLSVWVSQPQYVPLYTGLSASDAEAITQQLKTDNVSYQLTDGGGSILVPQDSVYTERLKAASAGLPTATNKGYSLLDNMSITTSEFQQNVTYQRAMEGELANTIDAMDGVKSSSVKLAIPQKTVFTDTAADPTASVFVATQAGTTLTQDQVQAIVHLTSASIVGMKPTDVSVIDSNGNVLSTIGGGTTGNATGEATTMQNNIQTAVQTMLDKVLGSGNSTVVANADLSQATGTKTTQTYTIPDGAPATSQSTDKETYTGTDANTAAGILGTNVNATTNGTANTNGTSGNGAYNSTKDTRDNALNSVTETQNIPAGALNRLTVSVAVNKSAAQKAGLSANQLNQLVAAAAGVDPKRGDNVAVQFVGFSKASQQAAQAALKQAQADQAQAQLFEYIKDGGIALGVLLALLVLWLVLRRRRKTDEADVLPADFDAAAFPLALDTPAAAAPVKAAVTPNIDADRRKAEIDALAAADPSRAAEFISDFMED